MQAGYWKLGEWKTIPLFFHWTVFLWLPWYWWTHGGIVATATTFVAFVALLAAHELGHAIAARSQRVRVFAIRLYVLHGQCEHEHPHYEAEDVLIAWGGVLAQLVVLVLAVTAQYSSRLLLPHTEYFLAPLFFVFIHTNMVIAAINLIPVSPLDGHKAWRVVPLLLPRLRRSFLNLGNALNFRKRRAAAKESQRAAAELLDRLTKK